MLLPLLIVTVNVLIDHGIRMSMVIFSTLFSIYVFVDFLFTGGENRKVQFPPVVPPRSSPKEVIYFVHRIR